MDLLQVELLVELGVPYLHDEGLVEVEELVLLVIVGQIGIGRLEVLGNDDLLILAGESRAACACLGRHGLLLLGLCDLSDDVLLE